MIEHCINEIKVEGQEKLYKNYVTTALQFVVYNTAGQESRRLLKASYQELSTPKVDNEKAIEDADRKAKEIIENFKNSKIFED